MRHFLFSLAALLLFLTAQAATWSAALLALTPKATVENPALNANNVMLPVGNTGKTISLMELSRISTKDFETLRGSKLNLFDKIGFKLGQHKLRKSLEADGTIKSKVIEQYARKMADGSSRFSTSGFALGLFLNLVGVLIAYLIDDDKKKARVKWAWLGFGLSTLLVLIILLANYKPYFG